MNKKGYFASGHRPLLLASTPNLELLSLHSYKPLKLFKEILT